MQQLAQVRGQDFEAVDVSALMVEPASGQVRLSGPLVFLPALLA